MKSFRYIAAGAALMLSTMCSGVAADEKRYGPGVTDSEIKIGQTVPLSGPASAYSVGSKAQHAVFAKVNAEGGVNGRKIRLISLDDGYSPPKTVEQTRRLVEEEGVLLLFQSVGTGPQTAVRRYLNAKRVPQLFPVVGAESFGDHRAFPWTMIWQPHFRFEARMIGRYLRRTHPNARIGVLYQNDDFGKELLAGLKDALGDRRQAMLVAETSYELSDPTVDSQIVTLQAAQADTVLIFATPKAATQAIRKIANLGWKPLRFVTYASSSVDAVMRPAGVEFYEGVVSTIFLMDPSDPGRADDAEMKAYLEWAKRYLPDVDPKEGAIAFGYASAHTLLQILRQCGDDLSRENVMRQAGNLENFRAPMLHKGVLLNTSLSDYYPIEQLQMMRFDGRRWVPFGDLIDDPH
jgi:branched-chain amino acid transport system substrate-binding protein